MPSPATTQLCEGNKHYGYGLGFDQPYASYAPAIVNPPKDSDVVEEWAFFYGLGQRMGLDLFVASMAGWDQFQESNPGFELLDMKNKPTTDQLHEMLTANARIPLAEIKQHSGGKIYPVDEVVAAKDADFDGRLCVGNAMMMEELAQVYATDYRQLQSVDKYPFRLICRRLNAVINSAGRESDSAQKKYNPAYMHPDDLAALALHDGDTVRLSSSHESILAVVEADASLLCGLISMPHAFGGIPGKDDDKLMQMGSNTGRLTSVESDFDPVTGIPLMSNIPVRLEPIVS